MKLKKTIKKIVSKFAKYTCNNDLKYGCNIYGSFEDWHSIAIIGRMFVNCFSFSGIPYILKNIGNTKKELNNEYKKFREKYGNTNNKLNNIYLVNLDVVQSIGEIYMKTSGKKTAFVFWEFETGLEEFTKSFDYLDEVYVCTNFIYNAVKNVAPDTVKVTKIPIPFYLDFKITDTKKNIRKKYNFNENDFLFFFNFDYGSSYDRKNPESIVKAFKIAYKGRNDIKLVIKTNRSEKFPQSQKLNQIINELNLNDNIIIINDYLSRADLLHLIYCMDCYISLHRGEGLGLGMLEAMSMALPVIATNYGGNTDFCNNDNSLLVNYKLVKCNDTCNMAYKNVQNWAEPDINQAAEYMSKLYEDRAFTNELGKIAQEYVNKTYTPENFAKEMLKFNWYLK